MSKSPPANQLSPLSDQSLSFLLAEYGTLKDLYSQSELAIQGLFNFYLTILSAIIGAVIVVLQISNPPVSGLGIVGGLLLFAIVIGIFHQWGIIDRYADSVHYAMAINEMRGFIAKHFSETIPPLYEVPVKNPLALSKTGLAVDQWELRMWWLFPVDVHQLFIAFVNSVCLAALIWIPLVYAGVAQSDLWRGIGASFLIFWLSIIANDSYAKIKLRREIAKHNRKIVLS